jgi:hypothetical protein
MGIPTDVSEDPKGDPTRVIPQQPDPGAPVRSDGVEPLIPRVAGTDEPPPAGKQARTPGDQFGIRERANPETD